MNLCVISDLNFRRINSEAALSNTEMKRILIYFLCNRDINLSLQVHYWNVSSQVPAKKVLISAMVPGYVLSVMCFIWMLWVSFGIGMVINNKFYSQMGQALEQDRWDSQAMTASLVEMHTRLSSGSSAFTQHPRARIKGPLKFTVFLETKAGSFQTSHICPKELGMQNLEMRTYLILSKRYM